VLDLTLIFQVRNKLHSAERPEAERVKGEKNQNDPDPSILRQGGHFSGPQVVFGQTSRRERNFGGLTCCDSSLLSVIFLDIPAGPKKTGAHWASING